MLKDHNAVTLVRLELAAPWSRVKHSTTALPSTGLELFICVYPLNEIFVGNLVFICFKFLLKT